MFTKANRTDVDAVEHDFVRFKTRVGEVEESLVERVLVDSAHTPALLNRRLSQEERSDLFRLRPWGYSFRIDDVWTAYDLDAHAELPASPAPSTLGRARQSDPGLNEMDLRTSVLRHIFERFGPREGESWLDVATNCGAIPLLMAGDHWNAVTAIDLLAHNIEKARRLASAAGVSATRFVAADAYDYLRACREASFDVISVLGLFYHLSDPIGMLNLVHRAARRFVIIDTIVHNFDFSGWIQTVSRHTKYEDLGHANDTRKILELHPTFRGLIDGLYQVGFEHVIEVAPAPTLLTRFPSQIYQARNRAFVLAFKDALTSEKPT